MSGYDLDTLRSLETRLEAQCGVPKEYELETNLALLKLYQFHPDQSDTAAIARVLVKALMALPDPDYLMCTYLIPEHVQEDPRIANIATVASLLETCSFRKVWKALEPLQEVLSEVVGFEDAIREFALHTIGMTFQTVPLTHVRESVNLDDTQLGKLLAARGWKIEGGTVKVTLNDDNTAKPKKPEDAAGGLLQFNQLSKILSSTFGLY